MTYCWRPTRGPVQAHILWSALALFFACFPCALRSDAQDTQDNPDVAETARQEKARKPAESKQQSHVYTNDDLQKPHILNEQDRARVEARKKSAPPPQTLEPAPSLDANDDSPAESLGEVARRYRREKAADFAEQASRPKPPSPFPMDLSQPTFAAPAPVDPPLSSSHTRTPLAPVAPPAAASKPRVGLAPLKRDPFSRPALSPSLRVSNPGPAPLILAPAKPSPVAPSAAVPVLPKRPHVAPPAFAVVPAAKPAPVVPPPRFAGVTPSKPAMISPASPSLPPAPPTSSVTPAISRDSKITVRPGDSLWKLSRHFLGAGSRWQDWLSFNPGLLDPHAIQPGMILVVPRATAPASAASARVLVRRGDSLWKIADTHYGNGAEWQCIATANSALGDPDQIYPGQVLVLPATCDSSQISKVSR